jgi:hypothetical protein
VVLNELKQRGQLHVFLPPHVVTVVTAIFVGEVILLFKLGEHVILI